MASIPTLETCRKRKRTSKQFGFNSFPEPGIHFDPIGPFRDNIRFFLNQCAEPDDYCFQGMPVWCTLLVHDKTSRIVPLYTIEEDVDRSLNPFCNHCRFTGWSIHFVSKRKYHFVIPIDCDPMKSLEDGVLNSQSHLLHGLIHCNGYGHLVCINGIEGGSKYVCGGEIMDLWDRICEFLKASKISVEDQSKKHGMDLRLLHGVAYGRTWFGRWGYRFCRGSYGVSEQDYHRAIEILSSHELDTVIQDFGDSKQYRKIKFMIQRYRCRSKSQLVTIRDLFKFVLTIKSNNNVIIGCPVLARCGIKRSRSLEYTIEAIKWKTEHKIRPLPDALPTMIPGSDDYKDVVYLYTNVLLKYPESQLPQLATRAVLDSKYFVKDWPYRDEHEKLLRLFCQVMPDSFDAEDILTEKPQAGVLVMVPSHATVFDLKQAAEKALRETYCITDRVVVTGIQGLDEMEDTEEVFGAVQSGVQVVVKGIGLDLDNNPRHEGGGAADNWKVRRGCRAWDDGERMVQCDVCEVQKHTRCSGIEDSEAVPPLFVCPGCCCCNSVGTPLSDPPLAFRNPDDLLLC